MRWIEKQRKIKKTTYSIIDKIADEIGLENSIYPEVYWIGKKLKFRDLKLNKKEEEEFESLQYCKQSGYLYEPRIILIGEDCLEHISEEASHFLHLTHSEIVPKEKIRELFLEDFSKKDPLTEFLKLKNVDLKFEDSIQNKTNFYKMFSKD